MNPFVSIIVPVYEVELYIENCMRSICAQTFVDFEVILVNDGSMDNSINLAVAILKKTKIEFFVLEQENQGVSIARNHGIIKSRGQWVICVDPDDILCKDFLKILCKDCIKADIEASFANFQHVYRDNLFKGPPKLHSGEILNKGQILQKFLKRKVKLIIPAMLVKKEFIIKNNLFYNKDIKFSEDQEYIWRILFSGEKYVYNETKVYNYFLRPNSTMTSSSRKKILTGYHGIIILVTELSAMGNGTKYYCNIVNNILPRWIIGTMRAASHFMSFGEYKLLAETLEYKKNIYKLIIFPDYKIKILAVLLRINLKFFYLLNKKL